MTEEEIIRSMMKRNSMLTDFIIETHKMAWGYKQEIEAVIKKRERRELWRFILKVSILVIAIAVFVSFILKQILL